MSEINEPDVFGQDLLSAALGESGLNLDEYLGNAPGNVLSQAMLDVRDIIGTSDSDFLDDINLGGDVNRDDAYISFTASNSILGSSNSASAVDKSLVSGVQQTFSQQPQTPSTLFPQRTVFETPRQVLFTNQSQQLASKTQTPVSMQRQNSSPILLNLLNSANGSSASSAGSVADTKKELTKK